MKVKPLKGILGAAAVVPLYCGTASLSLHPGVVIFRVAGLFVGRNTKKENYKKRGAAATTADQEAATAPNPSTTETEDAAAGEAPASAKPEPHETTAVFDQSVEQAPTTSTVTQTGGVAPVALPEPPVAPADPPKHQNLLARVRVWYRERQKRLREARRKRQEEKLVKKALKEKNSIKPLDYWRQFRQWWKKAKEEISDENLERLANNCTAEQERFAGWATKYHLVNETAKDAEWQWCDLAKKTSQPFTQMQEKYKFDNAIGDSKSVEHLRLVNCMEDPDVYSDAKEAPVVDHFCQNVADEEQSKSFSPFGDDDDE